MMLFCLIACKENTMKIKELNPIPDAAYAKGVSAPFCGMAGDILVVAGGANFPDKSLLDGGQKRVYADIWAYVGDSWQHAGLMPDSTAYGATFSVGKDLVFAGGNVNGKTTDKVFKVSIDGGKATLTELPPLPVPMEQSGWAQADGTLIIGGGVGTRDIYSCAPDSFDWKKVAELPEPLVQPVFYKEGDVLYVWGGFNPETLEVSDKGLCLKEGGWTEAAGIPDKGTFTGATGASLPGGGVITVGGVNRDIFSRALHNTPEDRIPYLSKKPEEYKFRKEVYLFKAAQGWKTIGTEDFCALAGAGVAAACDKCAYVAGGELKPGVRSPRIFKLEW